MTKKEYTLGENKIAVEHLIPDEKKYEHPIVLVHGSFSGFFMWRMIATQLAEQGFESYSLSLRGHAPSGDVDLAKVTMQDYADDVDVVVSELNLKNPVVIGHSMGGLIVLMYARDHSDIHALISVDPSQSVEVQGAGDEEQIAKIPLVYDVMQAGMPVDEKEIMEKMPDLPKDALMMMKDMFGEESGNARRDRKRGISVPKESITMPYFIIAGELAGSLPFGISYEKSKAMAEYYNADFVEIKGATHPGVIMGVHAKETGDTISSWLLK